MSSSTKQMNKVLRIILRNKVDSSSGSSPLELGSMIQVRNLLS